MRTKLFVLILIWNGFTFFSLLAQNNSHAFVDGKGILRWSNDSSEIHGFGINYTVPFAHSFRMAKRMGISHEEAIRQDVYHFARLDLDLFRVHVWDTEISDSVGNLLENEHLRLFDFAIKEMKKRGMKFIITPIAFWGNGWPEPDEETPGFSHRYGKAACLTNPDAIIAQQRYLKQFINHVNPYTELAYKEDPDVIAFEISNEPHHNQPKEAVREYINKMVQAMRHTGTQKPIFYNMSHSIHLVDAYLEADIQGGTFQWYPSGLVAGHALRGNFLPYVDKYVLPFAGHRGFQNKAKIIYEFDPADVAGNYIYPAMARSFRVAGFQLATQFAYDAMFLAPYNTNYGTHFMSLPYAPQKAISLKIASAVFHEVPMKKDFGSYPENTRFEGFRVNYEADLAEYLSETRFFYSNHTHSEPPAPDHLKEIAGFGCSPLVQYTGTGAYFLDKLEDGVWRLEVMPDAYWLDDPYSPVSPNHPKAAVNHSLHEMQIILPDLGENFSAQKLAPSANNEWKSVNGKWMISPGVFILKAKKANRKIDPTDSYKNILIKEFVAPDTNLDTIIIKNLTPSKAMVADSVCISFEIIASPLPKQVKVFIQRRWRPFEISAFKTGGNTFQALIPAELTHAGRLDYFISIKTEENRWLTYPSNLAGQPDDWDFVAKNTFHIDFLPATTPILLWKAGTHWSRTLSDGVGNVDLKPSFDEDYLLYQIAWPETQGKDDLPLHTFKYYFGDDIKGFRHLLNEKGYLMVEGQNLGDDQPELEISLITRSGSVRSKRIKLDRSDQKYKIPLQTMQPGKLALVPRAFPTFLPYFADVDHGLSFDFNDIECVQVSLKNREASNLKFRLDKIWLE
ncbi:cellulase family glycosylhydrolase [Thermophagus sp. OGC60D27]|uniref:cellulase family glycosylhydrolase n=1 Tax=Thermophagus sp. OGC60D27 TaxID=3458415 RepID=UPI0040376994